MKKTENEWTKLMMLGGVFPAPNELTKLRVQDLMSTLRDRARVDCIMKARPNNPCPMMKSGRSLTTPFRRNGNDRLGDPILSTCGMKNKRRA